jgi:osmoprotectant transport system permease protein
VLDALLQHIWLSLLPVVIGAAAALPVGYLAVRRPRLYPSIVNIGGVLYSIPSLALFAALPAILGTQVLSPLNVVVGLSIYTFALMTRTVADALTSVQGETTRAAFAMGYRPLRQLVGVELPMAVPVLFGGLRVATVANISLVSVGAIVGVGGLGALFTRGLQLGFLEPILIGIIASVLLAAVCDLGIVLVQRMLTPWARVGAR